MISVSPHLVISLVERNLEAFARLAPAGDEDEQKRRDELRERLVIQNERFLDFLLAELIKQQSEAKA
jgi:hypothetical protein